MKVPELRPAESPPQLPLVERVRLSRQNINHQDWRNRQFNDLNALAAEFTNCDFSYSIFNRGYFRDAKFTSCRFTGCQFYDCNFKSANFYQCELKFVRFYRCLLEAGDIVATLPLEPNIRREAIQNLRANAVATGDFAAQRLLVLQEMDAAKDHYRRSLRGSDTYYRQKYATTISKLLAGWKLGWLYLSGLVWGYGERPSNILLSGLSILLALTFLNFWSVMPRVGWVESGGGLRVLEYTVSLFLGISPDARFRGFFPIDYVIVITRYVYVGLYISALYKKISQR